MCDFRRTAYFLVLSDLEHIVSLTNLVAMQIMKTNYDAAMRCNTMYCYFNCKKMEGTPKYSAAFKPENISGLFQEV